MEPTPCKLYRAIGYARLSKDDDDRGKKRGAYEKESDSIANQRRLIREYVARHDDLVLVGEEYDDGYTGTNFDRPGFRAVLDAIQAGKVDCVIVKDLSRLGREYIETGKYLEMVFPGKGVRFIAINDDLDSQHPSRSDELLIPVKNLINEAYCRELSKKLRAQFALQRRNGEFLGAFAAYGYRKSPQDKHALVVDEYAAQVVRDIFALKMRGYSQQSIANALDEMGVLSPAEYKKEMGLSYQTGFQTGGKSRWSATAVRRILTNPLYTGRLVQGKRGTPNYKVKVVKERREEDWVAVQGSHDPIVDPLVFATVQKLLARDTRTPPGAETALPFSGFVFCARCQRPMRRRTVTRGGKRFYYFTCDHPAGEKGATPHSFSEKKLEAAVLHAVQSHIQTTLEVDRLTRQTERRDLLAAKQRGLERLIEEKERQLDRLGTLRVRLYEALTDQLIEREEYQAMRARYTAQIETARREKGELEARRAKLEDGSALQGAWVEEVLRHQNIQSLSREVVVSLIDKIYVCEDRRVHIDFNFRDEMADAQALLRGAGEEVARYGAREQV